MGVKNSGIQYTSQDFNLGLDLPILPNESVDDAITRVHQCVEDAFNALADGTLENLVKTCIANKKRGS